MGQPWRSIKRLTNDRTWPVCDPPEPPRKVGYQGRCGPVLLTQSLAGVDPKQTRPRAPNRRRPPWTKRERLAVELFPGKAGNDRVP
jgi:hypothetical protein